MMIILEFECCSPSLKTKMSPCTVLYGQGAGIKTGSPAEIYEFFVERVRSNLHIVLCLSPIGDAFRTRLRMFPSLVNCCTIDW